MKVKDLKKLLQNYNDEDEVVLAEDNEGNYFSPLSDIEEATYVPTTQYFGTIYLRELNSELEEQGYTEEDVYDGEEGIHAIVLYPVN